MGRCGQDDLPDLRGWRHPSQRDRRGSGQTCAESRSSGGTAGVSGLARCAEDLCRGQFRAPNPRHGRGQPTDRRLRHPATGRQAARAPAAGCALDDRLHLTAGTGAVSLYLPDRPRAVPDPHGEPDQGRAQPRPPPASGVFPRGAADAAPGHRRRYQPGADGDPERYRHLGIPGRAHDDGGGLQHLAEPLGHARRGATVAGDAGLCRRAGHAGTPCAPPP